MRKTLARLGTNDFYTGFYARHGVDPTRERGLAELAELPLVRKADILADIAESPPYGRRLSVPASSIVNVVESSGTSASGKEVQALSADDLEALLESERIGFIWGGASAGTVVALHTPVTMTAAGYWWNLALYGLSCNVLRLGGMSTERRLSYMKSYSAEQMMIGGHYLQRMTYLAGVFGYDLRRDFERLQVIFVGGGGWSTETAERWAEEWGAVLHEQYGSSQRCIAWTCERGIVDGGRRSVVHFLPQHYVAEVLDPVSGEQVGEGEEGEIVLTLLGERAMPLVRYATGDRAIFRTGGSCRCGRAFDGIEAGSVGRFDDMVRVRDRNLWPDEVDRVVLSKRGVLDYQAATWIDAEAQVRLSMKLSLEPEVLGEAEVLGAGIAAELKEATGLRFEVDVDTRESAAADRSEINDGKPRRWGDLRATPGEAPAWTGASR